jgi:hypothetical protein
MEQMVCFSSPRRPQVCSFAIVGVAFYYYFQNVCGRCCAAVQVRLRLDSQRKDAVIGDLRAQLADQLKFREQGANLQLQLSMLQDQFRARESALILRVDELSAYGRR